MTWLEGTEARFLAERNRELRIRELAPAAYALLRLEFSNLVREAQQIASLSSISIVHTAPQRTVISCAREGDPCARNLELWLSAEKDVHIYARLPSGSTQTLYMDLAFDGSPILQYDDCQTYQEVARRIMHLFLYEDMEYRPPGAPHPSDHGA